MELLALMALALVAGVVSFTSPCTLPLLPGYVSYVSGLAAPAGVGSARHGLLLRRPTLLGPLLFMAGFSAVFIALGVGSSALGLLLLRNQRAFDLIGGGFIFLMGASMVGLISLPLLRQQRRISLHRLGPGPAAALPLGAAFAFSWTPCIGPVLASILTTAAGAGTTGRGALLLAAYSLGLGVPFVVLAHAMARGRTLPGWLRRNSRRIEVVGGLVLIAMGVALMTGDWTRLMSRLLAVYAGLGWPPI